MKSVPNFDVSITGSTPPCPPLPTKPTASAVLVSLSDHDLQAAYDCVLEQFALELLIGAHENSDWFNGKLVIDANDGPIHLPQAAFYAVKLEVQRRGIVACCR